jgi:hypothetical protein
VRFLESDLFPFIKKYFDFNEDVFSVSDKNDYYTTYNYILTDNLDLYVSISDKKDENGNRFNYINKFYISTWDNGFASSRRWISFDFYYTKIGMDRIFFQISSMLCSKDWIKQLNTKLPTEGQCYLAPTNTDIYDIILNFFNEIYPGYISGKIREEQIKSVLE